mgnify:CR=1 FL=1
MHIKMYKILVQTHSSQKLSLQEVMSWPPRLQSCMIFEHVIISLTLASFLHLVPCSLLLSLDSTLVFCAEFLGCVSKLWIHLDKTWKDGPKFLTVCFTTTYCTINYIFEFVITRVYGELWNILYKLSCCVLECNLFNYGLV